MEATINYEVRRGMI